MELLDRGTLTSKARFELQTIARANLIVTTTAALREKLLQSFPVTIPPPILNVGLACGFDPAGFLYPRTRVDRPFAIAYIGSVYKGQGVDWLIKSWPVIQTKLPETAMLHIVGGNEAEVSTLRQLAKSSGSNPMIHGRIAPRELPRFLEGVDAVVIPAMPEGRMPHVAITKAYDFLGIKRPIIASNLASIAEILRHEREALLFEAANMESLAAALSRLMTVKNLAPNLVTAALHRANELTWQDRSDRYWQFLDQFGSAHPSSGS